jgi:signal transduction histidine kinase
MLAAAERPDGLSLAMLRRRGAVLGFSLIGIVAIAAADLATGYELALSILYVVPVVAATWSFGLSAGLALSLLATLAWFGTDILAQHRYSLPVYRYWEGFIRLATFVAFAWIIHRLREALARSDARLIRVLEGLDAAVCVVDPATGALLYRNRPFEDAFPGTAGEAVAQRLLEASVEGATGEGPGDELELERRWFLVRSRRVAWIDGRSVLLHTATDVTARRAAAALHREQEARLQATARLVAVGEIASSIAHELNQPLAAISSYVRGAQRRLRAGSADPGALAGALDRAGEQAERAGLIIRRVRDYVSSRRSVLSAVDLNAVVARAVAAAAETEPGEARVALNLGAALPPGLADAVMIEQVVLNLVRNAREAHRDAGRGDEAVEVSTDREGDLLRVTVADRGRGIEGEVADRLFEPFFTTKPEGTGLGLNICRSIVELHGGRVWAEPREGGGARFQFTVRMATEGA